jgi:hypothetical protein
MQTIAAEFNHCNQVPEISFFSHGWPELIVVEPRLEAGGKQSSFKFLE